MDRIKRLDSSLQRGLDNGFARVFGGAVVPTEIYELLKQYCQESVMTDGAGQALAPATFTITVSQKDYDSLTEADPDLTHDLGTRLGRYIRNNGWRTEGGVHVSLQVDKQLRTGQMEAAASFRPVADASSASSASASQSQNSVPDKPIVTPPAAPAADSPARALSPQLGDLVQPIGMSNPHDAIPGAEVVPPSSRFPQAAPGAELTVTLGVAVEGAPQVDYELSRGTTILGRGTNADLQIPDAGISRLHAELSWDGFDVVLTDLQSTNGTLVNGAPIDNWLLADGDIISIGHTFIEVSIEG